MVLLKAELVMYRLEDLPIIMKAFLVANKEVLADMHDVMQ